MEDLEGDSLLPFDATPAFSVFHVEIARALMEGSRFARWNGERMPFRP